MYEHLDKLPEATLLQTLTPLTVAELDGARRTCPLLPEEYFAFLRERGAGMLQDDSFVILGGPMDAAREIYSDEQIYLDGPYEAGAKGPVWVFGNDSMGITFGFDSGDSLRLVEIDNYRWVTRLGLTFAQFVEGLFVCHPQIPHFYSDGRWFDSGGQAYSPPVSNAIPTRG